ncbi:MAG: hypothetical protein VB036_15915 [Propionicimonas sp.]|nr:hypothetical protein [Propionicimonas sp.]
MSNPVSPAPAAGTERPAAAPTPANGNVRLTTTASRAQELITGRGSATTPRRLRLARLGLTIVAGVLLAGAIVTAVVLGDRQQQADVHATQYVRAESIQSDLLRAHGAAAASSVQSSDETAKALYETSVDARTQAAWTLLEITEAGTDNADVLSAISASLVRYGNALERASSQRGSDAARASLGEAYEVLTTDLLPQLAAVQTGHGQASSSTVPWWMWLLPVLGWLAAAAILVVSVSVARSSHRVVNLGLAVSLIATVTVAVYSGSVLVGAGVDGIGEPVARADALSSYRNTAVSGYAQLANGVATRTWTAADTTALAEVLGQATTGLDPEQDETLITLASSLDTRTAKIASSATAGDWATAEKALTATGTDSLEGLTAALIDAADSKLTGALTDVHQAVALQDNEVAGFGVIAALAALVAGLTAIAGLHQRLKEYR